MFAALIANIIGWIAFDLNKISVDKSFSFTASATQHTHLIDREHYHHRGSLPMPVGVKQKVVKFEPLPQPEGGYGFVVHVVEKIEEIKQPGWKRAYIGIKRTRSRFLEVKSRKKARK